MATRMLNIGGGGSVLQRQLDRERQWMDGRLQQQSTTRGRGIYAREVPASMRNHPMVRILDQVDAGVRRMQVAHEQNGQQIAAWQRMPMGTPQSAAEAQRLMGLVQQEASSLEQILELIQEAYAIARRDPRLQGTASSIEPLYQQVTQWHADAEADIRGLREAIALGTTPPIVQQQSVAPPEQVIGTDPFLREVHQALESVGQERQNLADDFRAFRDAPRGSSDRMNIALTLLVQLNAEHTQQQELSQRIGLALDAGRRQTGAGAQTRNNALREAQNIVMQWGQSLSTEIAQLEAAVNGE